MDGIFEIIFIIKPAFLLDSGQLYDVHCFDYLDHC